LAFHSKAYNAFTLTNAHEKGTFLEAIVSAIETLILESSPSAQGKAHRIESRKLVQADGVKHEIDLHVTTDIAAGYQAIFIFECKNWKESVDKDEIIIFSEKIRVCNAQHGYFVARSFTSGAVGQAAKDSRMTLRIVTEHDPAKTILPFGFQYTFQTPTAVKVGFNRRGGSHSKYEKINVVGTKAIVNGAEIELWTYTDKWATDAINESMKTFPSGILPDGFHQHSCTEKREFTNAQFIVNGNNIESIDLHVDFQVEIKRPAVTSHYEVNGRGRVIALEGYTHGAMTFNKVEFVFGPEK
jgi:hypothetical protein